MDANPAARRTYDLAVLTPERVSSVYPLVRHHVDRLDLDAWRTFAVPLIDGLPADGRPSTGIVVATRRQTPRGMFVYMRLPHLSLGRILLVPHAFCTELLRTVPLWALLLNEMIVIAGDLGCTTIHLIAHGPGTDLPQAVQQVGSDDIPIELLRAASLPGPF